MYRIGDFIDMGYYKNEEFSRFLVIYALVVKNLEYRYIII